MKELANLSLKEIAFEICSAFDRAGITAVLVGGGAAAVHAPNAYETRDLDFVLHFELFGMPSSEIITNLGFEETANRGTYRHPSIPYTLEIMHGPIGIGGEYPNAWETQNIEDGQILHVFTPTQSVKDRLATAIHYRDFNSARQAAEIAKLHLIDLDEVKAWCDQEGGAMFYEIFAAYLK